MSFDYSFALDDLRGADSAKIAGLLVEAGLADSFSAFGDDEAEVSVPGFTYTYIEPDHYREIRETGPRAARMAHHVQITNTGYLRGEAQLVALFRIGIALSKHFRVLMTESAFDEILENERAGGPVHLLGGVESSFDLQEILEKAFELSSERRT